MTKPILGASQFRFISLRQAAAGWNIRRAKIDMWGYIVSYPKGIYSNGLNIFFDGQLRKKWDEQEKSFIWIPHA